MLELRELFAEMLRRDASDLHIVVGAPPQIRVRGDLVSIPGMDMLQPDQTRELIFGILTNEQRQKLEVQWEIDFSYSVPGMARWRVNAFYQRGAVGAAFRVIPEKIKALSDLGVPDSLFKLCDLPRGLVLVTGPTGSGKSTTLAGMIDVINEQRSEHILTVEDPIEFIHKHKNCIINQREVGADTDGFSRALKSALRQDPDVILVGEMRDLETIQTALTAAETGHLVFGTLHTNGAAKTVDRIIDVFPPHQQAQVRVQLASSLQGVVTQTLVPTIDGKRRVVACEIMIPNSAIRNLIREGKVFQIPSIMQTSQSDGMQTLDAALATLVRSGQIDRSEALKRCAEEAEFERMLASGAGAPIPGQHVYRRPEQLRLQHLAKDIRSAPEVAALAPAAPAAPVAPLAPAVSLEQAAPLAPAAYAPAPPEMPATPPMPAMGAPMQFAPPIDNSPAVMPHDAQVMHSDPSLAFPQAPAPQVPGMPMQAMPPAAPPVPQFGVPPTMPPPGHEVA